MIFYCSAAAGASWFASWLIGIKQAAEGPPGLTAAAAPLIAYPRLRPLPTATG